MSRAEKNLMFRYLHNELTPIINGLVQRAMLQRPIDPLQFAIQDLMDQQVCLLVFSFIFFLYLSVFNTQPDECRQD